MTANEMVRDLVNNYGYTRHNLAKLGLGSITFIRQLYEGSRGRYPRKESMENIRAHYIKLTGKENNANQTYKFNNMAEFEAAVAILLKAEIAENYQKGVLSGRKEERSRVLEIVDYFLSRGLQNSLGSAKDIIQKGKRLKREAKKKDFDCVKEITQAMQKRHEAKKVAK